MKLQTCFALLCALPFYLFSTHNDLLINNHVNVITGKLQLEFEDHIVEGAVPLSLRRGYTTYDATSKDYEKWQFAGGWSFFSENVLRITINDAKIHSARILERSGFWARYSVDTGTKEEIILKPSSTKEYNQAVFNYRENPENDRLIINLRKKTAVLMCADGSRRVYKKIKQSKYLLDYQESSSGQRTYYEYFDEAMSVHNRSRDGKKVFTGAVVRQVQEKPYFKVQIQTSDKHTLLYSGKDNKKRCFLYQVESSTFPVNKMVYENKKGWIEAINLPKKNELSVIYNDEGKVKDIYKNNQRIASFKYEDGPISITKVCDCSGIITEYHVEKQALSRIRSYSKSGELYSEERFMWEEGMLTGKGSYDGNGHVLCSTVFEFDEFQNMIKETFYGNLTGQCNQLSTEKMLVIDGAESYSKWYKYNNKHLLIEEREENGLVTCYSYLHDTDLITSKRQLNGDELLLEERFKYDEDYLLIEKVVFDGFRETKEIYVRDPQSKKIVEIHNGLENQYLNYDNRNQLIEEKTDFTHITYEYDHSGKMICKTHPLGAKDEFFYDEYGNPMTIKERGQPKRTINYDDFHRPTLCVFNGKQSTSSYDLRGNLLLEKDYRGVEKAYSYDMFGRCIKDEHFIYQYDCQGNVICQTDNNHLHIKTTYNAYNKPTQMIFEDGSHISFIYSKNGLLSQKTLQDGSSIFYDYDVCGRLVRQRQGEFEEIWEYEGSVLKKYTDQRGLITTYDYDEYGRKISEDFEGRKKEFFYDEKGFCCEVKEGDLSEITIYDIEGKVIEKSQNGFKTVFFEYDENGYKTKAIKGDAIDQFFYDVEGKLNLHIDPYNHKTLYEYDDFSKTTIDPLGNRLIETYDEHGRLIHTQKQSKDKEILLSERFIYDGCGNLIQRITDDHDQDVVYTYDNMNRVIEEIESNQKLTQYQYDIKGRLKRKIKPDRLYIDYVYDEYDRCILMESSDGSLSYEYIYKGLDLVEIKDHITNKSLKRSYTKFGELTEEVSFSGFKTSWYYDTFGRKKQFTLPDQSSIQYEYTKNCLFQVSRHNKQSKKLYQHTYTKFDHNHHVEEEFYSFNLGKAITQRDLLERPTQMSSSFHKIELEFGATHLITKKSNSLSKTINYEYDDLSQITKEGDRSYEFDSLGHPKECKVNRLNQITSTPTERLIYDSNGNLVQRNQTLYRYDALDRLIDIFYKNGKRVSYTYDPFNRLVSKQINNHPQINYLYDQDFEIGTINQNGDIQELKVLGLGVQGDIGGAIAIELAQEVYIPLHDLQGNVVGLVDSKGELKESYNPNAFGEEPQQNYINPWRFSSKRSEEGLIFFGLRFYDPSLKRWITPDPSGYTDSRNLYLYVLNNPINRLDQFGLETIPSFYPYEYDIYRKYKLDYDFYTHTETPSSSIFSFIGINNLSGTNVQIAVSCQRDNLSPTVKMLLADGMFNLKDHLCLLIENTQSKIPLVTYQNGINNSFGDWISMGESIVNSVPRGTTVIGLRNPSNGFFSDTMRASHLKGGGECYSVRSLKAFFTTILDNFEAYARESKMLHIAHSEAGAIYNRCFEKMPNSYQDQIGEHFYIEAIGPAECISKNYGLDAWNYYSTKDYITGWFAKKSNPDYNVIIEKCITPWHERNAYFADHSFEGRAYKGVRKNIFGKYNDKVGFYVGQSR